VFILITSELAPHRCPVTHSHVASVQPLLSPWGPFASLIPRATNPRQGAKRFHLPSPPSFHPYLPSLPPAYPQLSPVPTFSLSFRACLWPPPSPQVSSFSHSWDLTLVLTSHLLFFLSHISQVVRGEVTVCREPLRRGLPAPTALEERPPLPALLGFVCSIKPSTLARCALA
jgi:hypothetical protein